MIIVRKFGSDTVQSSKISDCLVWRLDRKEIVFVDETKMHD